MVCAHVRATPQNDEAMQVFNTHFSQYRFSAVSHMPLIFARARIFLGIARLLTQKNDYDQENKEEKGLGVGG